MPTPWSAPPAASRRLPEPDYDEAGLLAALRALGVDARTLAWDDPAADPAGFDLCVVRSTWNYIHALPEFLGWLRRTASVVRMANPPELMAWNCDKAYLLELALKGVPIIPTRPASARTPRSTSGKRARPETCWSSPMSARSTGTASAHWSASTGS